MRLLLILEHRFFRCENGVVYCERVVDYNYLKRYLDVFDEVVICARFGKLSEEKKYDLVASGPRVSFVELFNFNNFKSLLKNKKSINKIVKNTAKESNAILLRAPSHLSFIVYKTILSVKKPIAVEIVVNPKTAFSFTKGDRFFKKIFFKILKIMMIRHTRNIAKKSNGVSYVTEYVLQQLYPSRARINGENLFFFEDYYSSINLRDSDYSQPNIKTNYESTFKICHTGYMDSQVKGHTTVLRVLKILLDLRYDVQVTFIGHGKLLQHFKQFSKTLGVDHKVIFLSDVNKYSEVQKHLVESDLFLYPSLSEGLPRALIEAMANSMPCVSSPVDGIVELLSERYLAPHDSPEKLAEVVINFMNNIDDLNTAKIINFQKAQEYQYSTLSQRRKVFYGKLYLLAMSASNSEGVLE